MVLACLSRSGAFHILLLACNFVGLGQLHFITEMLNFHPLLPLRHITAADLCTATEDFLWTRADVTAADKLTLY